MDGCARRATQEKKQPTWHTSIQFLIRAHVINFAQLIRKRIQLYNFLLFFPLVRFSFFPFTCSLAPNLAIHFPSSPLCEHMLLQSNFAETRAQRVPFLINFNFILFVCRVRLIKGEQCRLIYGQKNVILYIFCLVWLATANGKLSCRAAIFKNSCFFFWLSDSHPLEIYWVINMSMSSFSMVMMKKEKK